MAEMEMTLDQWCGQLPACHKVNKELAQLRAERDRLKADNAFLHERRGQLVIERDQLLGQIGGEQLTPKGERSGNGIT